MSDGCGWIYRHGSRCPEAQNQEDQSGGKEEPDPKWATVFQVMGGPQAVGEQARWVDRVSSGGESNAIGGVFN